MKHQRSQNRSAAPKSQVPESPGDAAVRVQSAHAAALELVDRHRPALLRQARTLCHRGGLDAEDLVDEMIERLLRSPEPLAALKREGDAFVEQVLTGALTDYLLVRGGRFDDDATLH